MPITLIFVPRGGEIPPPPKLNFKFKNLIWKFLSPTDVRRSHIQKCNLDTNTYLKVTLTSLQDLEEPCNVNLGILG
jgi:hypothetical protein